MPDECDIAAGSSLDTNLNGVPDECENDFLRGDSNGDGMVNIGDVLFTANYLFVAESSDPLCLAALDANDDGTVDISDPLNVIFYLFLMGAEPPPPFGACGGDSDSACLPCTSYPFCP